MPASARERKTGTGYEYDYPMLSGTVTVVLKHRTGVVVGKRVDTVEAFPGFWCIPGGFINAGKEDAETAALREIKEEVGIEISRDSLCLFYVDSNPKTDPRGHVLNICYAVDLTDDQVRMLKAGDDLSELNVVAWDILPEEMAFNHLDIVRIAEVSVGR